MHNRYQFSFLAYHMLMMGFVYFNIWQIRKSRPADFRKALIGFAKDHEDCLLADVSPFRFSIVGERAIFRLLKLVECEHHRIQAFMSLVKTRNKAAHSTGSIVLRDRRELDRKVSEILRVVDEIQEHHQPVITEHYFRFLIESGDVGLREHENPDDQIREVLVHGNYMSANDVAVCVECDISRLRTNECYEESVVLHDCLGRFQRELE